MFLAKTKKIKFFFKIEYQKNSMGGVSQKPINWTTFLSWQKFLAEFSAGNFENWPIENFLAELISTFRGFEFEAKTKKLEGFKVRGMRTFRK